jgi:tRNA nucleotidyltransferase/poly(A) polymerase
VKLSAKYIKRLKPLAATAEASGAPLYIVGGAVRDALLAGANVTSLDIDIVVEQDPQRIARAWTRRWGGSFESFGRFGTVRIRLGDGLRVDVARARTETYPRPAALPVVKPATLAEDLKRRDFTVNALALRFGVKGSRLIDLHGGEKDLQARRLRILHPGSFVDDPTRMFRAARYAGRFGFRLETATQRALLKAVQTHGAARLSPERLRQELMRILAEKDPGPAMGLLKRWGLLTAFHKDFRLPLVARGPLGPAVRLGLIALVMGESSGGDLLKKFPLPHAEGKALRNALKTASQKESPRSALSELAVQVLKARFPKLPKTSFMPSLLGGKDLQGAGIVPGKAYSELLARAARAQWRGELRTRTQAKRWLNLRTG